MLGLLARGSQIGGYTSVTLGPGALGLDPEALTWWHAVGCLGVLWLPVVHGMPWQEADSMEGSSSCAGLALAHSGVHAAGLLWLL